MIYRIMIVEDEPPSMRNIEKNINSCGVSDLEVIAKAYNGMEALKLIPKTRPHIIFTDVKMPVMDGFSLVEKVRELYPDILIVILSGYQEFDYVKKALKFELSDYLLKPIDIEELSNVLVKLKNTIDLSIYQTTFKYLHACINNYPTEGIRLPESLNHYYVIMINSGPYYGENFLHGNQSDYVLNKSEVYNFLAELTDKQYTWVFECNNLNLLIAVVGFINNCKLDIEGKLSQFISTKNNIINPYTTVTYSFADSPEDIPQSINSVRERMALALIPGKSQFLNADDKIVTNIAPTISWPDEKQLLVLFEEKRMKSFTYALSTILKNLITPETTQQDITQVLNFVISFLKKLLPKLSPDDVHVMESFTMDTIFNCASIEGIIDDFVGKIYDFLVDCDLYNETDSTTEEVIEKIAEYLDNNFSESIEFKSLAVRFGISYTYLSTIFKKHKEMTPMKYLLTVRVNKAKEFIESDSEITFKQVAELVGYNDPHYFSRIFRSMTGLTPSEYRTTIQPRKNK